MLRAVNFSCRIDSKHHAYFDPKTPDKSDSRLLGIKKANPAWWVANSDSPLPWWWRPDDEPAVRRRSWLMRNPMHNFTNYVIGVADRPTHRIGLDADSIWNENGPFNLAVTRAGPFLYLPMVSYRGFFIETYVGWRERGNFGGALRRAQHDSDGTGRRGDSPLSRARERGLEPAPLVEPAPIVEPGPPPIATPAPAGRIE